MGDALEVPHLLPEVNLFGRLLSFPTTGDGQLCFSSGYSLLRNWDGVVRVELLWDGRFTINSDLWGNFSENILHFDNSIGLKDFCVLKIVLDLVVPSL